MPLQEAQKINLTLVVVTLELNKRKPKPYGMGFFHLLYFALINLNTV
jgi:hypothetical protein